MNSNSILHELTEKVYDIISVGLKVDKDKIVPQSRFIDDLAADSLDQVELVMAVEEEFEIEIPEDDAEKFHTVQDLIDYVASKKMIPVN